MTFNFGIRAIVKCSVLLFWLRLSFCAQCQYSITSSSLLVSAFIISSVQLYFFEEVDNLLLLRFPNACVKLRSMMICIFLLHVTSYDLFNASYLQGWVVHCTRYGGRIQPKIYKPQIGKFFNFLHRNISDAYISSLYNVKLTKNIWTNLGSWKNTRQAINTLAVTPVLTPDHSTLVASDLLMLTFCARVGLEFALELRLVLG